MNPFNYDIYMLKSNISLKKIHRMRLVHINDQKFFFKIETFYLQLIRKQKKRLYKQIRKTK
jgi:hypothetical protein